MSPWNQTGRPSHGVPRPDRRVNALQRLEKPGNVNSKLRQIPNAATIRRPREG
jgi:hypothetical protein